MRTIEQMVDDLMEAARGHGEAHADDAVFEWSTGVLGERRALLDRIQVMAGKPKPLTMWKLINRYAEAACALVILRERGQEADDQTGVVADLQLEIRRRLKRTKSQHPMAGAVLDGMELR